ncbi:protein HEAT INTOLERANT 4-like [Arachis duranensis]|uniref:Protein HEAT INTOLERANT 4-like n=1 Tax=Arachis duranensis TaxID=130453 RepID=A0A9C6TYH1_ARADU|nr:protein HEAT INTOLERANT 4-like [Arachis duranensis]
MEGLPWLTFVRKKGGSDFQQHIVRVFIAWFSLDLSLSKCNLVRYVTLRKGTKRRREPRHEPQHSKKHSTKPPSESEDNPELHDEYFDDKCNLQDFWREVFLVGTEWDQLDSVYQYKWNFSNLENAFEEGGVLHGKKVYLFGCTEPQQVCFKDVEKVILVPIIVAVVSPFPPSDKIGITSVQRETEEIIPMKQMKMDWIPYIPSEDRYTNIDRLKSQIFILSCTQRRAALKHLKLDQVKKYEYCLPYFYHPFKEDELEQSTEVQILFPTEPKPVFCSFDWKFNDLEEFSDELIKDEELSADQKEEFKDFVKEKVREAKKANKEAREARRKAIEEMSEETKVAFENMRFYKFYPVQSPDSPPVSKKCHVINRYYGKAHEYL